MFVLIIKECKGYELVKELPNTSEDYFNKSEVHYVVEGKEQSLTILYVRFFEEQMAEYVPYKENPLFQVGSRSVELKDLVALVCLMKNSSYINRKRVYINSQQEFAALFQKIDFEKLKTIFQALEDQQSFTLEALEASITLS